MLSDKKHSPWKYSNSNNFHNSVIFKFRFIHWNWKDTHREQKHKGKLESFKLINCYRWVTKRNKSAMDLCFVISFLHCSLERQEFLRTLHFWTSWLWELQSTFEFVAQWNLETETSGDFSIIRLAENTAWPKQFR